MIAENMSDNPGDQLIAKAVTWAICLLYLSHARRVHHVELLVDQHPYEHDGRAGVIGVVTVNQDINVGLDVGEHAPYHIALALQWLATADCPGGTPPLTCAI